MTSYAGINPEVTESYRRTLIFNNILLMKQFDERYEFRVSEQVRKMRAGSFMSGPATEDEIQKYMQRQEELKEKRREQYTKRLESNVEPSVRRYAESMRGFIGGEY